MERWWWLSDGKLQSMARFARASSGVAVTLKRAHRSFTDEQAAIAVEAAFVLQSESGGARAAKLTSQSSMIYLASWRGVSFPRLSPEVRGRNTSDGARAKGGDAEAKARIDDRHAHQRAVGEVLRVALGLVDEPQPSTGRFRLPPQSPKLAAALSHLPPRAITALFPGLIEAVPQEEEPDMSRVRTVPSDEVIRRDAAEMTKDQMAGLYGVSESSIYTHCRRLGISPRSSWDAVPATAQPQSTMPVTSPSQPLPQSEETEEPRPLAPVSEDPRRPLVFLKPSASLQRDRLGLDDLALVAGLVERGIAIPTALAVVRADLWTAA